MFEKNYKEAFDQIQPSEALQQETLELMKEAQNHRPATEPPRKTWKLAYTVSLASTAAAIVICVISASFWLGQGQKFEEPEGEWDVIGDNDSAFTEDQQDDKDKNITDPGESDDTSKNHEAPSSSASNADKDANNSLKSDSESDVVEDESKSDPNAPVIINNADTKTYLSLADFASDLEAMTAPGFGTNYLYSKELMITPSFTFEDARFRCLYLDIATGNYIYSYLITAEDAQYYLEIRTELTLPKTADELSKILENMPKNVSFHKEENGYRYYFTEQGEVTVRLYPTDGTEIPDTETVDQILKADFVLHRYDPDNPRLNMTY